MKKKIIIVVASASLGATIMFIPFLGKDSSPQKNDHQHLIKNSPEEKQNKQINQSELIKKENELQKNNKTNQKNLFWICFAIIGIGIVMIAIFVLPKIIQKYRLEKYLSGKCSFHLLTEENNIEICFYPGNYPYIVNDDDDELKAIYNLDIRDKKDLPNNFQIVFQQKEQFFIDLGKLFRNFFDLLDGRLLKAVYDSKNEKNLTINEMYLAIEKRLTKKELTEDPINIYKRKIEFRHQKPWPFKKNADPIAFFKNTIAARYKGVIPYINCDNQTVFVFSTYCFLYDLIRYIFSELEEFSKTKTKCQKLYQKVKDAKDAIDDFLKIDNQPNN